MAKYKIHAGSTSFIADVFLQDTTSTTGTGLSGLVHNSSGLTCYYKRKGDPGMTQISLGTATVGTWAPSGFIEVDSTHAKGLYELHLPDTVLASGAASVTIYLSGATNMAPVLIEIELDAVNYQDSVRFGLTSLPGAAAATTGGLATIDSSGYTAAKLDTADMQTIGNTLLDLANGVETGETVRQFFRELRSVLVGISNEASGTLNFYRKDGVTVALTVVHNATGSRISSSPGTI